MITDLFDLFSVNLFLAKHEDTECVIVIVEDDDDESKVLKIANDISNRISVGLWLRKFYGDDICTIDGLDFEDSLRYIERGKFKSVSFLEKSPANIYDILKRKGL
jgi:hypothetical protein